MSKLSALSIAAKRQTPVQCEIEIEIPGLSDVVEFDNLRFGFTATCNGKVIAEATEPPPNVRYVRSTLPLLGVYRILWNPDDAVTVTTWYENAGKRSENTYTLTAPRPVKPYDSWQWVPKEKVYKAPIDPPTRKDGEVAVWDESKLSWSIADRKVLS